MHKKGDKMNLYYKLVNEFSENIKQNMITNNKDELVISIKDLKTEFCKFASEKYNINDPLSIRKMSLTDDIITNLKPFAAERYYDWYYFLNERNEKKVRTILSIRIRKQNTDNTTTNEEPTTNTNAECNWREILSIAKNSKEMLDKSRNDKFEITKCIHTNNPILIVLSADWHFGAAGVRYDVLLQDMDVILNNEDIYILIVGDEIENMNPNFKNKLPPSEQVIPRELEISFYRSLISEMIEHDKIIASSWGNHDAEFDERTIGYAVKRYIVDNPNLFLPYGGFVNLNLNDIDYRFRVSHTYKGHSIYNPNHSNVRSTREKGIINVDDNILWGIDADIQAHGHIPAIQIYPIYNRHIVLVKTGSYMETSPYGARYFETTDTLKIPCLILTEDQKNIIPILGFEPALKIFNSLKIKGGNK